MAGLNLRDLVAKLRIVTDKKTASDAEKDVKGSFERMEGFAKNVGKAIAAAFAVHKVLEFGKSLVEAAVKGEAPWIRLSNTLANVGIRFKDVERQVRLAARAMQDASTMGDEEFAETLGRLTVITGDFGKSLKNVQLVANVAAKFFNGELAPATDLVGKLLNGNTRALRALGISTKDAEKGLEILAARSAGAAANELNTLEGKLKQVNTAWGDFKKASGNALIGLSGFVTGAPNAIIALNRIKLGLQSLTETMEKGQVFKKIAATGLLGVPAALQARADLAKDAANERRAELMALLFQRPLPAPGKRPLTDEEIAAAKQREQKRQEAQKQEVAGFVELFKARALTNVEAEKAVLFQKLLNEELSKTVDIARRGDLATLVDQLKPVAERSRSFSLSRQKPELAHIESVQNLGRSGFPTHVEAIGDVTRGFLRDTLVDQQREKWADIENAGTGAAMGIAGAFQDTFSVLIDEFGNVGEAAEALGRGITGALLGGVAQYASGKMKENIAYGFEEIAKGLAAAANPFLAWSAPIHYAAAAKFGATAVAWGALAGGSAAGQSAIGGGGRGGRSGGIPSGAADGIGRTLENPGRGPQTIIYVDGFNAQNPVHVRTLAQGIKAAGKSDSSVEVRPRGGR